LGKKRIKRIVKLWREEAGFEGCIACNLTFVPGLTNPMNRNFPTEYCFPIYLKALADRESVRGFSPLVCTRQTFG